VRRAGTGAALVSAALVLLPASADAFVSLKSKQAPAGADYTATFTVEHGCAGSPTVRLRIRMPDGVSAVKPLDAAGWKVSAARARAEPDAAVVEVVWLGGTLEAETPGEFAIAMRLPDAPGTTLYFPVTQECEKGSVRWAETPSPTMLAGALRFPAPALTLSKRP